MYRLSGHLNRNKHSSIVRVTYKLKKLKTIQNPQVEMEDRINLTGGVPSEERAPGEEEATQDHLCCCTVKHESKTYFQAHLMLTPMCFWTLTKNYWFKSEEETQYCSICDAVVENAVALKIHCFNNVTCKLHYLHDYFKDNKSKISSRSEHLNTENPLSSASTSRRNATSRSSNPSTPVRSNPNSATSNVPEAAGETSKKWKCEKCEKSYKEESSLKAHITKAHKNGDQGSRSSVNGNGSTARATQSTRRERLADGSHKGFDCGKCLTSGYTRQLFIIHVMNTRVCLKHYENPRNSVPHNLRYCFKCKKNHRNIKESENHDCLGVVLKTFECPVCKQRFHTLKSLRKHEKSEHRSERS
jgi:uncharacterized C2H2 Zn-finger protein